MAKYLIFLCAMFFHLESAGLENKHEKERLCKHPVDFSFGNISVGMPFTNFTEPPFSPMVSLGSEFYYKQKDHIDFYQTVRLTYYFSKYSTSGIVLNSEAGFRYKSNSGLFADAGLGLGYAHLFRPNATFKQNGTGEYAQISDWGTPGLLADFFLCAGYDLSRKSEMPLSLYIKYGNYIDILYAPDIPALPHNFIQIGARYSIPKQQLK